MRSYFVYCKTLDNQFMNCSIHTAQASPTDEHLIELAYREFARIGNPLPPAWGIQRLKLVQDCRNFDEPGEGEPRPLSGGYAAYSEYSPGDETH